MVVIKSVFLASLLVALVATGPTTRSDLVVKASKSAVPSGFVKHISAPADHTIPLRIALVQSNIAGLEMALYDVSTPGSANYGKHLSKSDVSNYTDRLRDICQSLIYNAIRSRATLSPRRHPLTQSTPTSRPMASMLPLCPLLVTGSDSPSPSAKPMRCLLPISRSTTTRKLVLRPSVRSRIRSHLPYRDTWTLSIRLPSV